MPQAAEDHRQRVLVAVYDQEAEAQKAIERLRDHGFPMDMLSILGRVHPSGDDVLGVYYKSLGSRVEAWARQGALWGGLWGLLTGAGAMFVMPVVGPIFAAGPIVEAIVSTLAASAAGAAAGGALGGAAMAGAAAMTHLSVSFHRMGVPQEKIQQLHKAIEEGHFVLLLRESEAEANAWLDIVKATNTAEIQVFPYRAFVE